MVDLHFTPRENSAPSSAEGRVPNTAAQTHTLSHTSHPLHSARGWWGVTQWKLQGKLIAVWHSCNYSTEQK